MPYQGDSAAQRSAADVQEIMLGLETLILEETYLEVTLHPPQVGWPNQAMPTAALALESPEEAAPKRTQNTLHYETLAYLGLVGLTNSRSKRLRAEVAAAGVRIPAQNRCCQRLAS